MNTAPLEIQNWDLNIEMLAHIQNNLLDILSIFKCKSITPFLEYK